MPAGGGRTECNVAVLLESSEEGIVPQRVETMCWILQISEIASTWTRRDKHRVIVAVMAGVRSGSLNGGG